MSLDTNKTAHADKSNILGFFKRHYILTGFLITLIAIVGWWQYAFPSATWRYKMTVTVETPEGIKTGSAVREIHVRTEPKILPEQSPIHYQVNGEAVAVDLGHNQILFYTLGTDYAFLVLSCAYGVDVYSFEGIDYYQKLRGNRISLKDKDCLSSPFVTFKNIADLDTIKVVNPIDLESTFGKAVRLQDVTIEITDEPITRQMTDYLGELHTVASYEFVRGN